MGIIACQTADPTNKDLKATTTKNPRASMISGEQLV